MSEERGTGAPSEPGGSFTRGAASDAWYPAPGDYWVPAADADQEGVWPHRFGDLFHTPATDATGHPLATKDGTAWHAVMAYSPSCELVTKAKDTDTVEVVRVLRLDSQSDARAAAAIIAGWQEKDARITVAYAHTVFLAPVPGHPTHGTPMFAHLKTTARVTVGDLRAAGRIAATGGWSPWTTCAPPKPTASPTTHSSPHPGPNGHPAPSPDLRRPQRRTTVRDGRG